MADCEHASPRGAADAGTVRIPDDLGGTMRLRDSVDDAEGPRKPRSALATALLVGLGLAAAGAIFARIMTFPLRHDEQFYVPAGILFSFSGLYRDFGFNHLPNLPIMLSALFQATGTHDYLLAGRLLVWAAWLAGGAAIVLITLLLARSRLLAVLTVAFFVTNPILLGPTGMTVTNNFIPIALSLFGLYFFLLGGRLGAAWRKAGSMGLSGFAVAVAVGCKVNYVFLLPCFGIALLCAPVARSLSERLRLVILPFAAGALIGAAPTLAYLVSDPADLWAHVVRYHRVAQRRYWAGDEEVAIGLGQKLVLAHQFWILGAGGLVPLSLAFLLCLIGANRGPRAMLSAIVSTPVLLIAGLMILGCAISFVPTPSFPQYYSPPIVFGIVLVAAIYGLLRGEERRQAIPLLIAVLIFVTIAGGPQLLRSAGKLVHPREWTGMVLHRDSAELARRLEGRSGPVATLAPLYPLEAGLPIYPALWSGPFVYRVGDVLRETEAEHYRNLTSPAQVGALFERTPPAAVLVGLEGELDRPLAAFAQAHGYQQVRNPIADRRGQPTMLYLSRR